MFRFGLRTMKDTPLPDELLSLVENYKYIFIALFADIFRFSLSSFLDNLHIYTGGGRVASSPHPLGPTD